MRPSEGFGERIAEALALLRYRERKVSLAEIGRRVAERLELPKPIPAATVQRWGASEPDFDTVAAFAAVLGVDPGWLAFGDASSAAAPPGWEWAKPPAAGGGRSPAEVVREMEERLEGRPSQSRGPDRRSAQ